MNLFASILSLINRDGYIKAHVGYNPQLLLTDQRTAFEKKLDEELMADDPNYSGWETGLEGRIHWDRFMVREP